MGDGKTLDVVIQFSQNGTVHCEETGADSAVAFTVDAEVLLSCLRSPKGMWMIDTSDYVRIPVSWYRERFPSFEEALMRISAGYSRQGGGDVQIVESFVSEPSLGGA